MANGDGGGAGSGRGKLDILAIILSAFSLTVSVVHFLWTEIRPASVETTVGQKILLNAKPRIGLLCTFTNSGALQKVITSASLRWDDKIDFNLEMTSPTLEQWELDDKGSVKVAERTRYSPLVAPIPVKGRDQSAAILWFTTEDPAFKFTPGRHKCSLKIFSRAEESSINSFQIELTDEQIKVIDNPSYSATEVPIKVIWENLS